ncbi:MAG: F390 synthetase-related protein [Rhabdochlamydiaceae bacterium]
MFKKLAILYYYLRAKRLMRFGRKALQKWQNKHKAIITDFARRHSPFYQQHLGEIISKKIMMNHFSTFNTKQIDKEKAFQVALSSEQSRDFNTLLNGVTVGLSSGTSGSRGLFLVSDAERLAWCGNMLAKILPKAPWRRQRVALFLRANSPLYETVNSKTLTFAYFDLLEDPATLKQKLEAFAPDVLAAPPSMLLMLTGCCKPKRVISIAEVLSSADEKRLEAAFGQKIFQIYQCTEGFLGFTCSHGTLHLNEDLLIIEKEFIDERHFIPIITDLFRKTQPIIRYRLDDVLVEKKTPCRCGCIFQALERIEGRCDDVLYVALKEGGVKPLFPDFVSRRIVTASENIADYEVTQTKLDRWEIYLKPEFRALVNKALDELFTRIDCVAPQIVFIEAPSPRLPGAKLRRIRRQCAAL